MHRGVRWLLRTVRRLLADQRGNAAVIFGFAVMPLVAATGLAVDTVLAYNAEGQLQKSLDAAGLAAGRAIEQANIEPDARSFFDSNFASAEGLATLTDFDVDPSDDGSRITLTATATLPTSFMRVFGHDMMTVRARTVVARQTTGLELALVLDITASMLDSSKLTNLKTATRELLTILYGNRNTVEDLWVAIVPYIASVNVGRSNMNFLASNDRARGTGTAFSPDTWYGCVLARSNGYDRTDDPPSTRSFTSYLYPDVNYGLNGWDNDWGTGRNPQTRKYTTTRNGIAYWEGYGPNAGCPDPITPLVAEKSTLNTAIDALKPWERGGTIISEGLVWGWRAISPRWRGLWSGSPSQLPLAYNTENMRKVIVLLTDGDNQMLVQSYNGSKISPYNTYVSYSGLGLSSSAASTTSTKNELDARTTSVCNNIKAQAITLYTITFGSAPTSTGQTLMRNCASRPEYYFHAPTGTTLRSAFQTIGGQLSSLRIVE
jgi:Flp pilus assembly protein TadG